MALADEVTGLQGAFAILTALRHRDRTGEGQVIDLSLLESLVDVLGPGPGIHHRTGHVDGRYGSRLVFSAPRNIYAASDGHIVLSGSANEAALRIFDAIGRPELRDDDRFKTCPMRVKNVEVLDRIIEAWTTTRTVKQCVDTFSAAGAACGPVYDVADLIADEHVQQRESFVDLSKVPTAKGRCYSCGRRAALPQPRRAAPQRPRSGHVHRRRADELGYDAETIAAYAQTASSAPPAPRRHRKLSE